MWPAHFTKGGADGAGFLGVVETGADFCFGGGGENIAHDAGEDMDRAIERRRGGFGISGGNGAEEKDAAGSGAGFGLG